MAEKTCPQCGETVDVAKAFCPACGNAFVDEEKRTDSSAYEKMDNTVQMGQTMYNNMLSDMGLNVKKEPEKRVEVLKPIAVQPAQTLQPVAGTQLAPTPPPTPAHAETAEKKSNKKILIVTIAVAVVLVLIFAVAVIAVAIYYLYFRSGRF